MSTPYFYTWSRQKDAESFPFKDSAGCFYYQEDGSKVFDGVSTSFQAGFGHSFAPIVSAIESQLKTMPICPPKAVNELKTKTSEELIDLLQVDGGKIFYTVSGAESIENALKMARQVLSARKVMARKVSYHGASLGALSITGDWRSEDHFSVSDWTIRIPEPKDDPDLELTRKLIEDNNPNSIAAVVVETVTGANGVIVPPGGWLKSLELLCKEFGIFFILDEVLCGFGRTGSAFAFQELGLRPDMVCMSKAITGGYIPFGAVWVDQKIAQFYDDRILSCGLTNYAHPLGLAATRAVVATIADKAFMLSVKGLGDVFEKRLRTYESHPLIDEIRVKGLLGALVFDKNVKLKLDPFVRKGVWVLAKDHKLILAPPLIATEEELNLCFDAVDSVLKETVVVAK